MMRNRLIQPLPILIFCIALVVSGCEDDGNGVVQPTGDLVGTYVLVSITFEGQPTLGPPVATGTLVLTETTYSVDITIAQPDTTLRIVDSGTYQISGNTWSQESAVQKVQSEGTFSLEGDTLTVTVTTLGMTVQNVWRKT